jgi:fibronectin-binding autotransporter adhesin
MSNELAKDTRRHRRSGGGTLPRAALLAGVSLIALAPNAAHALDGTWTGPGAEWTDGTNWSSTPDVPDDTATFTNNAAPTSVAISNDASINTIQFTAGAPAFNFTTSGTGITFDVNGAGIVNNSALAPTFINNDNLNFNNASSAGNAVIVNNNGAVLSFNNNSTAANATITTNNGALTQFNDNSTGGNAQFVTNAGGVVDFSNTSGPNGDGSDTTFSGTISGSGRLVKVGEGTLTLSGNNSYQGGTIVSEGTLAVGSSRAVGTGALTLADGTTLQAAANGLAVANVVRLNGDVTVDTQSNTMTLSGPISGTGGLDKIGSGTLMLTGASTYTGTTTVSEGVLNVNGSLVSTVCVCSGATLTGTGSIGGLSVSGGGIVAPGNSIGTLTVRGNVSFDVDGIYQVKANAAGQSDKINATGTATLTGGTVQVLAQGGTYARQTRYTILTANAGVTGKFTGVTSNLAFLTALLSYDSKDVFLTLARNDVTFASAAQTPNQRAVALALDRSASLSPLVQAVANLSATGARQAFDALSGELHGSVQTTIVDDSRYIRQAVLGRLRQAPYADGAGNMAALGSGGPMLAYAAAAPGGASADGGRSAFPINPSAAAPVQSADLTFWAQGVGAWGRINSDGNAADVNRNLGGVFTGFDRRFGEWRAGLAGGYTNSSASVNARASSASIDTAYFAGYTGTSFGPLNFRSGAAYAWHTIATNRSVMFPGFSEQASARYNAQEGQVFGELGYGMSFGDIAAEPFAGVAWLHLSTDGFTETGGVSALGGASGSDDVGYSTLGARWASNYLMANGMMLMPRASLAWQHAFAALTPTTTLTLRNTGAAFGIWGVPIARDAALIEAGGDLQLSAQTKVGIFYVGQLATNAQDHSVKGNFTWRF